MTRHQVLASGWLLANRGHGARACSSEVGRWGEGLFIQGRGEEGDA